ncbi:MAG: DEAD/DEAH box helicase [Caldilineaceae bacterium]|nr:DEAD/DEAH box helicase [Caldilineaceae bacterium]
MNDEFSLLHPAIQKWVYKQGWRDLRAIQKRAIKPILSGKTDVVISAPTAGGKTEAVFLPACSAAAGESDGFGILYISPLKALINDQYRRLESLCEMLDMKVTPWHGDSPQSKKRAVRQFPEGILLITPESLEARLIRDAGWVRAAFESLKYVVIDEYHAFIGFERGHHLQSLLTRLEHLLGRQRTPIPRLALSATLGDMDGVLRFLRPDNDFPCKLIVDSEGRGALRMQVRGYIDYASSETRALNELTAPTDQRIARDLFEVLRGDSHLVFANSRGRTELYAALLSDLCEKDFLPNEFFPHHGSLSKELRGALERRLQKEKLPTTAVCTMTLELGIDIGKVNSIAQVTAPHSVASLRQRLGRSGRRGDPAILRMFIVERELTANASLSDKLRIELLQCVAMIRLLLRKWYEPADTRLFHFSTLLHQILAIIAQWGGVGADQLWSLLCRFGPFEKVTVEHFKTLLTDMGQRRLITQLSSGELVLAEQGENLVNHFSFYSVFHAPQDYRIVVKEGGKTLGTLPVDSPVAQEQHIVFGGRRWKVMDIDVERKVIYVSPAAGGKPPVFHGSGMSVHERVRQEMLKLYLEGDYRVDVRGTKIDFMDDTARKLFQEGLTTFRDLKLESRRIVSNGKYVYLIPWTGDQIVNTLTMLMVRAGYTASNFAGIIEIHDASHAAVSKRLKAFVEDRRVSNTDLAKLVKDKHTEKYDHLLPEGLLDEGYGAKAFDVNGTKKWLVMANRMNLLQPG